MLSTMLGFCWTISANALTLTLANGDLIQQEGAPSFQAMKKPAARSTEGNRRNRGIATAMPARELRQGAN